VQRPARRRSVNTKSNVGPQKPTWRSTC